MRVTAASASEAPVSTLHLHLLLNHVPVLGAYLAILVLAAALVKRRSDWARAGLWLVVALTVVAVGVLLSGEAAEEAVEHLPGVTESAIERHEEAAKLAALVFEAAGALALVTLFARRRREIGRRLTAAALAVMLVVGGTIGYAAGLGGLVRHTELRAGAATTVRAESGGEVRRDDQDGDGDREQARR
jgi:uncharacterized membrane protein